MSSLQYVRYGWQFIITCFSNREQLEVKTNPISTADTVLHPNQQQPLLHLTSHVPILTSDLLHVEECLQSRVKLLEGEKKSASLQILELEEALMLQKKEFHEQTERLTALHEEILCKVRQRISSPWAPLEACNYYHR